MQGQGLEETGAERKPRVVRVGLSSQGPTDACLRTLEFWEARLCVFPVGANNAWAWPRNQPRGPLQQGWRRYLEPGHGHAVDAEIGHHRQVGGTEVTHYERAFPCRD